jgi:transposase
MDPRHEKGIMIAATARIGRKDNLWLVPSQSHNGTYTVNVDNSTPSCSCLDHETRGCRCKHIIAVEILRSEGAFPAEPKSTRIRVTYRQDWAAYNAAQTHEQERVAHLLRALCDGIPKPFAKPTGRPRLPRADIVFGLITKVYSTFSGRRADTNIRHAKEAGLVDSSPHYNSLFRYMNDASLTPILVNLITESALPLAGLENSFAVDSSGFATTTYARWFDHKWGRERREATYIKAHLVCGTKTHVVTRATITDQDANDSPKFKRLINSTCTHFNVQEISADKAYLSHANLAAVVDNGAVPYIPFKENSRGDNGTELWRKLWHFFQFNREEFLAHYHKRSNVESTFAMIKAKFGSSVRSKTLTAQTNEVLCKIIAHNLCVLVQAIFEFGIEPTFWNNSTAPQSRAS